jgi:hypothetical protein
LARSINLASIISSVHEKKRTKVDSQTWREVWRVTSLKSAFPDRGPSAARSRASSPHRLVELVSLIQLAGEAVDEETTLAILPCGSERRILGESGWVLESLSHGVLEELRRR